jgi:hypothetical protein
MIPPIQTRGNPINPTVGLTTHTFGTITEKIGRYLTMLLKGGKYWSVGWRICPTPLLDTKTASFSILGDDGHRAYADPFPMCRDGQDYLFVEEFPFATQRGCISVATIENGQISTPRPVLEEPWHLSYPFVFEHAGEVWMIPESGNAHGIYLYRADPFPYRWTREGCLIDGIDAHDSTLLYYEGRFWLFVCEKVQGSSAYDILSLFYADKLAGPWLPHTDNPVLFDATLSRPAGAMFLHDGHIIRPTQDCSHGYGGAVTLCHVNALTESSFCQSIIGSIRCEGRGCHTYNMASRITKNTSLEVIDTFGRQRGLQEITAFHASCILGNPE